VANIDLRDDLARIAAPTLVVSGANDQALPPEHQRAIADGVPGARLMTVQPGAHLANLEQPDQITAALLDHFDAAGLGRNDTAAGATP
jgi:3-oxoadipate enol-lactonase